jgi:hypothetical protein
MISDDFAEKIRLFLERSGVDIFYAVTILGFLVTASYYRDIENWSKLEGWHKGIILSTAFGTTVLLVICLLRLAGTVNF